MSIRVLHVIPDLIPYGAERVVATLASQGSQDRYSFSVASLFAEAPGSLAAQLRADGVCVFHLDKKKGLDLQMFPRLNSLLRELRPQIVHTHNYVLRYVLPPALLQGVPHIVHTIHNVAQREVDKVGQVLQKWSFGRRVQPVVIADEAARTYREIYRNVPAPLIRNGIAVARYAAAAGKRQAWRRKEGFAADDLLFVCVARFDPQKNHKTLLEAFAAGPARIPNAKLVLAGDGRLREEVEAQARGLNIADRMFILGRRDDIPEVLAAGDVFSLASLWEGNPLSVMEALAAGLPSTVTAVGGVPELVANGKEGFVVPAGDTRALAESMLLLGGNPELRRAMGEAAARRARNEFDDRHMVAAYESLYQELLSGTPVRGAESTPVALRS